MVGKKLQQTLTDQLKQGATPKGLALSCAVGVSVGMFPLMGLTTLMGFLIGYLLKLNHPTIQAVNYLMAPVQLIMIPILLLLGEWITQSEPVSLNPKTLFTEFFTDIPNFFTHYGPAGVHAVLAWVIVTPLVAFIVYWVCHSLFKKMSHFSKENS